MLQFKVLGFDLLNSKLITQVKYNFCVHLHDSSKGVIYYYFT